MLDMLCSHCDARAHLPLRAHELVNEDCSPECLRVSFQRLPARRAQDLLWLDLLI